LIRNVNTIKESTEALLVTNREVGLEVDPEITEYMVMSCEQNAGQNHIKTANKSFENVAKLEYLFGNDSNELKL
jgi:hypothetical protein